MKILAIGDIVGRVAIDHLKNNLSQKRKEYKIDYIIANGENASDIHGLSCTDARDIYDAGVDFITLGNHTWNKRDLYDFLDDNSHRMIRPANYPSTNPGYGASIVNVNGYRVLIMNVCGVVHLDELSCPFEAVENILEYEQGNYDLSILDIHAEATSEKYALARCFDGKINIMFGTHTHVQTADEQILPGGSAYITDLGMTGPCDGVIGSNTQAVLWRMRKKMPSRLTLAEGAVRANCVLFDVEPNGKVNSIQRINF